MKPNFKPPKKSAIVSKALATAEPEEDKVDISKIPLVTAVIDDPPLVDLCKGLLAEAEAAKRRVDADSKRLTEIRAELGIYAACYELPGMKWGGISLSYSGERTNKRLDKGLLIENGVSPETIAQSYKETKPFIDSRFILAKQTGDSNDGS